MDMQIRKQLFVYLCIHSVWKVCLVTPLTSAHCGYWLPLAAPLSAPTVEVTIKDYVMFQIVFATLHQAGLSTGGVKCYTLKLYHPPQYMVNMIWHDMTSQWHDITMTMMISVKMSWHHNHTISTGISMWHLDMCYVPGGLHNHLTHSTTNDKDLKLQTIFPPAAKEYGHVTQSWTASTAALCCCSSG